MNFKITNARVLTMADGGNIIKNASIEVDNGKITYIGDDRNEGTFERVIDAKGNLVMPGFKNAHTHSAMTFLRSYADDLPLQSWLYDKVFPAEAKLSADDIYHLTKLAVLEYLTTGVTAIFDMYLTPDTIAKACDDMGMRCVQVGAVNNFSQSAKMVEDMFNRLNQKDSLNSYIIGFHAEYTCDEELLKSIAQIAHKYSAPVFTHNSETESEVKGCMEHTGGMTPTQYLDSLGIYDFGGGGYHCVYMDEKDLDIFEEKKLFVVTNPSSNLKLASGIAPINECLKRGIKVAIGTDGPASNNCLDMFREMFLVTALAKYKENDASAVDAVEVLKMATVNGALAMGLKNSDVLAPGKCADFIMLDLNRPNMQPINNIAKNIVYSGSKENVKMTVINGEILYEDGKFNLSEDVGDIYAKCQEITDRIKGEV